MQLNKTRLRNRLGEDMLHQLLMVAEEGGDFLTEEQRDAVLKHGLNIFEAGGFIRKLEYISYWKSTGRC